jgi:methylmalonyl-CoA mutase
VPENKKLFDVFKSADRSDWQKVAQEELNGADPVEKLIHKGNGFNIEPYYDRKKGSAPAPLLSDSGNSFLGSRSWHNCPRIDGTDVSKMNEMALDHLKSGADGLLFELPSEISFEMLLKGIDWTYCSLNFLAKKNSAHLSASLKEFISKKKIELDKIHGAFFGNDVISPPAKGTFRFSGFQIDSDGPASQAIAKAFNILLTNSPGGFSSQASNTAFSVQVGNHFFDEVSKLRAIRIVWQRVLETTRTGKSIPLMIHCHSARWVHDKYQPHGNMLKSTTASLAAIFGGCDTLTVDAEDSQDQTMVRAARNVSNILREEAHLSKVADPVAGSYFVESLSRQIADAAWNHIQLS